MLINRNFHLEEAVSKDALRPGLQNIYIMRDKPREKAGRALASEGHYAVSVPCEMEEGDTEGVIPPNVLKMARKIGGKYDDARIESNGSLVLSDGTTLIRYEPEDASEKMHKVQGFIADASKNTGIEVCLDPFLLASIAKAINAKAVVITFDAESPATKPAFVRDRDNLDRYGVLCMYHKGR